MSPASPPVEECIFPFDGFLEQVFEDKDEYSPLLSTFGFNNFD